MKIDLDKMKEVITELNTMQLKYIDAESMYIYHSLDEIIKRIIKHYEVMSEALSKESNNAS